MFVTVTLVTIHIEMGSFVRGIYDLYQTGAIEWFQLGFNSTLITETLNSRYFTGFDCLAVSCTEFVSIRLVMVVD